MARIFARSNGTTTVELLCAAVSGAVVLAALYGFYRTQLIHLVAQEGKTATLEDARGALDIMVRELRNAGYWESGAPPAGCRRIVAATAELIRIQADFNGDGDCDGATAAETGEDVTYELTGPTPTCPGAVLRRNRNCLAANVVLPPGQPLFSYFDETDSPLPAAPPLDRIRRVRIALSVEQPESSPAKKPAAKKIASTLSSSVEFRNAQ